MINYTNHPFFLINQISSILRRQLAQRFENAGYKISPEEWALLLVLWSKGAQSPGFLSEETIKDRTTVTRLIDGLVKKGIVERREDEHDRRRSIISLTEYGGNLRSTLPPIAINLIEQVINGVSPDEIETTAHTLQAFSRNLATIRKKPNNKGS